MFVPSTLSERGHPLEAADVDILGEAGTDDVDRWLASRADNRETPLHALPALASELGLAAVHVKDEGFWFGLGSFKALGGAYAVTRLVLEEASRRLGRSVGFDELGAPDVRAVAETMTVACATDGNHGRSVAQGAQVAGTRAAIFVHSGVSEERVAAIGRFGTYQATTLKNCRSAVDPSLPFIGSAGPPESSHCWDQITLRSSRMASPPQNSSTSADRATFSRTARRRQRSDERASRRS